METRIGTLEFFDGMPTDGTVQLALDQLLFQRGVDIFLDEMRAEGRKVVAHFVGDYLPTELIYAAGAAPVGLVHGGDPVAVDALVVLVDERPNVK